MKSLTQYIRQIERDTGLKRNLVETGYASYLSLYHRLNANLKLGANIYDFDWDLLILLDACRVDALRIVSDDFSFLNDISSIWSRGSSSHEWFSGTFTTEFADEIEDTVLTTPNGFAEKVFRFGNIAPDRPVPLETEFYSTVDATRFQLLDTPWIHGQDTEYATVAPNFMTDRGIYLGRKYSEYRHIVQYYQPHIPYLADAELEERKLMPMESNPWAELKRGSVTKDEVWEAYLDNLSHVLESIGTLLNNFDAERVLLTADHAELFGELGLYSHPEGIPHPKLRKVPFVELTANDEATHTPSKDHLRNIGEQDYLGGQSHKDTLNEHLRNLGYKS